MLRIPARCPAPIQCSFRAHRPLQTAVRALGGTVAVALAAFACSDRLAPAEYVGAYSLRTVNDLPVPQEVPAATGCTRSFEWGSLTLGESAFRLAIYGSGGGCPGGGTLIAYGLEEAGGGVAVTHRALQLQFVEGMNSIITIVTIEATVSGSAVQLTLPPGAMNVAAATTLGFGPSQ